MILPLCSTFLSDVLCIPTLVGLSNNYVSVGPAKWNFAQVHWPAHKIVRPIANLKSNHLEFSRTQHERPAACVNAQQYSFTTFASLGFYTQNEKFVVFLTCW